MMETSSVGQVPERPNGADCKSAVFRLQWFESTPAHIARRSFSEGGQYSIRFFVNLFSRRKGWDKSGSSSVGRATAFQAVGRGFEPRLPLSKSSLITSIM